MSASSNGLRKLRVLALFLIPGTLWAAWFHYVHRPVHRLQGPRLVYWAWERPEDLRLLNPQTEAVAFLASSVELASSVAVPLARQADGFSHLWQTRGLRGTVSAG